MKKSICIILVTMCIMGLSGCNEKDSSVTNNSQSNQSVEQSKDLSKDKDSDKKQEESKENKDTSNKGKEDGNKNKETSKSTTTTTNSSQNIITKDFKEISSMQITYSGSNNTYSIEKNGDFIKKVYDSILSTKGTVRNDRDESDPKFIINIIYKSGSKDVIQSTESGQLIYRVFDNNKSRVCTNNTNLFNIIKNGK